MVFNVDLCTDIGGAFKGKEVHPQEICMAFSEDSPEWFLKDSKQANYDT